MSPIDDDDRPTVARGRRRPTPDPEAAIETKWSAPPPGARHRVEAEDGDTQVKPKPGTELESVAWLYCRKGLRRGHLYQFRKQRNEFGRSPDCDVTIEDDFSSAHHGAVLFDEGAWRIFDFASTNGTFVNGKRLGVEATNPLELQDGDVVSIGETELVFKRI
jgi:hypothetical protein